MKDEKLLQQILNDPRSTEAEKTAAAKKLKPKSSTNYASLDSELEGFWNTRAPMRAEARDNLTPQATRVVDDLSDPMLGLVPVDPYGSITRLSELIEHTKSELVRSKAQSAIDTLTFLLSHNRIVINV